MNNPVVNYFLARIGIFVAVLCILLFTSMDPILAALFAAVISFALSLLLLRKQRDKMSELIYNRVNKAKATGNADNGIDVENQLLDQADSGNAPQDK
jgi:ABC-type bacteriocin/lantibiotic exporter with double-glycine peptidase domain